MAEEPSSLGLQFEKAELAGSTEAATCAACASPVHGVYYDVAGATTCERCVAELQLASADESGGLARFLGAAVLGGLAAILGSVAWFGIRRLSGYEFGLLAIAVGFLVGAAVRKGARGRGGARYQALAMFLTYSSIVVTYVPELLAGPEQEASEAQPASTPAAAPAGPSPASATAQPVAAAPGPAAPAPADTEALTFGGFVLAVGLLLAIAYAAPFLALTQDASALMGVLIIAIGLYEAWKLNRRTELAVSGPHRLSAPGPARE